MSRFGGAPLAPQPAQGILAELIYASEQRQQPASMPRRPTCRFNPKSRNYVNPLDAATIHTTV